VTHEGLLELLEGFDVQHFSFFEIPLKFSFDFLIVVAHF
jgi:hypothetical protein